MPVAHFRQWNLLIRRCTAEGRHAQAVDALRQMRLAALLPDSFAVAAAAKSCGVLSAAPLGASLHGFLIRASLSSSPAATKGLIDMYLRLGFLRDSLELFSLLHPRDAASWNILLSGCSRLHLYSEMQDLFLSMHHCSSGGAAMPNSITLAVVLPVCGKLRNLQSGRAIHGYAVKMNLERETLAGNALVSMYFKCGDANGTAAAAVFRRIAFKDVVSWNSMISGYVEAGRVGDAFELLRKMVASGSCEPNAATFVNVLPVCPGQLCGKEIHGRVLRLGIEEVTSVCNALMAHYSRTGDSPAAELVFRSMSSPDVVSWNTVIGGCAADGRQERSLDLFRALRRFFPWLQPDKVTLVTVLPVCAQLGEVSEGRKIHGVAVSSPELRGDTSVGNALLAFYGKCGRRGDAVRVFSQIEDKDLVSWNSLLAFHADAGDEAELLAAAKRMQLAGFRPDSVAVLTLLRGGSVARTRQLHGFSLRAGFMDRPAVANSMADTYSRGGLVPYAVKLCEALPPTIAGRKTMISIFMRHGMVDDAEASFEQREEGADMAVEDLMIQCYAQNGRPHRAIALFLELRHRRREKPGGAAITSLLAAGARLASMQLVRQCHGYSLRAHLISEPHLVAALVDSYCKCGGVDFARRIFTTCGGASRDVVCFTAMAAGYAMSGMAAEAFAVFREMVAAGIEPDHVSITAMLAACSHAGLLQQGVDLFRESNATGVTGEQYGCMVDLFARGGMLTEAFDFARAVPDKVNGGAWGALLGGCRVHGEAAVGRLAAERLFAVETENVGNYVVMSNVYAAAGRWDDVEDLRRLIKARELKKPPGCSWIEVAKSTHVFVADDVSHSDRLRIYGALKVLNQQIKEAPGQEEAALTFGG